MIEWSDLRFFLAVHRHGSLAAAGRALRVAPTTVGRRVTALEERLRATLFVRGSGGWLLTPAGRRVVAAAERAEEAAADVQRLAGGAQLRPEGRVRVATLEILASQVIAPALPRLLARHPGLRVDLWCGNKRRDITRGEVELAVRVGRPSEPSLIARRLATVRSRPYASRAWLAARGVDAGLDSLAGCEVLLLLTRHPWLEDVRDQVRPVLRSTEVSVTLAACREGLGVALLPDLLAQREPGLVPLDALGDSYADPIWLVMHQDLARVARVRAVADFMVALFGQAGPPPEGSATDENTRHDAISSNPEPD